MQESVKAIKNHDEDNVATVFGQVATGTVVQVLDKKGKFTSVKVLSEIPYGHKVALAAIAAGQQVTKYGEEIGIASKAIAVGEHVHVHNIESIRGRGDWEKQGELR